MPDHQLIGPFGSDHPCALAADGRRIGDKPDPSEVVLHVFPAASWDAAVAIYNDCKRRGIAAVLGGKVGPEEIGGYWRFPGASGPLLRAAVRLGISTGDIHRAEAEAVLKNVGTRVGEAFARYQQVRGPSRDDRGFTAMELRHVEGLLAECLKGDARLHAMACASRSMIEECRAAHGLPPGDYRFRVVGPKEDETARLHAEVARLKAEAAHLEARGLEAVRGLQGQHVEAMARLAAENAELLGQNKQLVAMVESLTAPAATPAPGGAAPADTVPVATAVESAPSKSSPPVPPRPQHKGK